MISIPFVTYLVGFFVDQFCFVDRYLVKFSSKISVAGALMGFSVLWVIWYSGGGFDSGVSFVCFDLGFYLDGVAISLILLSSGLLLVCCTSSGLTELEVSYFVLLGFFVTVFFVCRNLLVFYICFEGVLFPMFVILGLGGHRARKSRAGYMLFLYTLSGSLVMLLGIILIYLECGSYEWSVVACMLTQSEYGHTIWVLFFIGFMVKVPLVPFHLWLGEAHVEAPTEGSVVLAGILLKLGSFGIYRVNVELLGDVCGYYLPLVSVVCVIGVVYMALAGLRQVDIKRVIAYGSVGHMSLIVLGLCSGFGEGVVGGCIGMISHGIVSGGLFMATGCIFNRVGSRNILYYGGFAQAMPVFSVFYVLLMLGNIGFPGSFNFVSEVLLFTSCFKLNCWVGWLCCTSMVLNGCYSLWLLNRIIFGNLKVSRQVSWHLVDLDVHEFSALLPMVLFTLVLGVFPGVFIGSVGCI